MIKDKSIDDGNIDIYSIITLLILRKFTLFWYTVIGLSIGYFTVFDYRTNIDLTLTIQFDDINLETFTGKGFRLDNPVDALVLKEIVEYDFVDRFKRNLISNKNISEALIDQNILSKNFDILDAQTISTYQKNLKFVDSEYSIDEIIINYKPSSNKKIEEARDFLQKIIMQSQKTTINEVIELIESNLHQLEKIVIEEKRYSKIMIDKKFSENKIKLEKELEALDAKYLLTIETIKKHIDIALELNYDDANLFTDLYEITTNSVNDLSNADNGSQRFATERTILSLSKTSGIPLYMFGYKLLRVELNALEKNRYAEVKKDKQDEFKLSKKYDLIKYNEDYNAEILFFKSVLNDSLNKLKSQNYSDLLIDKSQLEFITITEEKIAPNSMLKTLLIGLVFFIISIFVVLYQNETLNRKSN